MARSNNHWFKLDLNEHLDGESGYPRPDIYLPAKQKVARYARVRPDEVVIANGSAHALELIFPLLFKRKDILLLPVPTFIFYTRLEKFRWLMVKKIPYHERFSADDIIKQLKPSVKALYLANPNNPLGYQFSLAETTKIIRAAARVKALVVVDEAYFEFGGVTVKHLVRRFNNLVVTRTFSKAFGLAGLRMGYVITNPKLAVKLEIIKGPLYHLGRPGLERVARLNGADIKQMKEYTAQIKGAKKQFYSFCEKFDIRYWPSSANFVTIKVPNANLFTTELKKRRILITNLNIYPDGGRLLKNCVRITMPTPTELPRLLKALAAISVPGRGGRNRVW